MADVKILLHNCLMILNSTEVHLNSIQEDQSFHTNIIFANMMIEKKVKAFKGINGMYQHQNYSIKSEAKADFLKCIMLRQII